MFLETGTVGLEGQYSLTQRWWRGRYPARLSATFAARIGTGVDAARAAPAESEWLVVGQAGPPTSLPNYHGRSGSAHDHRKRTLGAETCPTSFTMLVVHRTRAASSEGNQVTVVYQ